MTNVVNQFAATVYRNLNEQQPRLFSVFLSWHSVYLYFPNARERLQKKERSVRCTIKMSTILFQ